MNITSEPFTREPTSFIVGPLNVELLNCNNGISTEYTYTNAPVTGMVTIWEGFAHTNPKILDDAIAVLSVEHFAFFNHFNILLEQDYPHLYGKIIVISSKGSTDKSTRFILHKIAKDNNIPLFLLRDNDVGGLNDAISIACGIASETAHNRLTSCPSAIQLISMHETMNEPVYSTSLDESDRKKITKHIDRFHVTSHHSNQHPDSIFFVNKLRRILASGQKRSLVEIPPSVIIDAILKNSR